MWKITYFCVRNNVNIVLNPSNIISMRYFLPIFILFNLFCNNLPTAQAADLVPQSQPTKTATFSPILPIEPSAAAPRAGFWQKTKQDLRYLRKRLSNKTEKRGEVEPISEGWYKAMAIFATIQGVPVIIGITILSLVGLTNIFFGEILFFLLSLLGFALVAALFLYLVHLFAARMGKESKFLRGKRFFLGYISGFFLMAVWILAALAIQANFIAPRSLRFIIDNGWEIYVAVISGLILALPILIFNIIDHLWYRKYVKSQQQNQ